MASTLPEIFITSDGSPTLICVTEENYQEKMHHSGGAWSETLYIYLSAMQMALETGRLSILSVGLGLGYNEILSAALHLKSGAESPIKIASFESSKDLIAEFTAFLNGKKNGGLYLCYQHILKRAANHFDVSEDRLLLHLRELLQTEKLQLRGPFPKDLLETDRFNCILYDAFSSKMNPELWGEEFLKYHLQHLSEPNCIFSTYACTGNLKRALRSQGFEKIERPGFSGKRESSLYRRISMSHLSDAGNEG